MKNVTVLLLTGFLAAGISVAANDSQDEKQVMATLELMSVSTVHRDVATLDKVYHDTLSYSHTTGRLQTKAEVLKDVSAPDKVVASWTFSKPTIRFYGSTAVVRCLSELRSGTPSKVNDNHLTYIWVLVKGNGPRGWQIVAGARNRLPAETS